MFTETRRLLLVTAALSVTLAGCSTAEKNMAPPPKPAPIVAPAPPPPPPPPKVMAPAPVYVIDDVNFDLDRATLKPRATDTLDRIAGELHKQPDIGYEVAGFTDSTGTEAYNQGLSERRAASVHNYLVKRGVDSGQLTVRGYGESNPVASNANREGRAQNRRVEIRPRK